MPNYIVFSSKHERNGKATVAPSLPAADVKVDTLQAREAVEKLESAIPAIKGEISVDEITASPKALGERVASVQDTLAFLKSQNDNISIRRIIRKENLLNLLNSDTFYCWQTNEISKRITGNMARELFLQKYFQYFGQNIEWKPFLNELYKYEEASQLGMLADGTLENYVKRFNESVVTGDYARFRLGLPNYARLLSHKNLDVEEHDDKNRFYTTEDGKVFIPVFVDEFETREENLSNFRISVVHEVGHHLWNTFEININPEVLDYEALGLEYVGYDKDKRALKVRKRSDGSEYEVTELGGLVALVEFPKLLSSLHNIRDDERVDKNNMEKCVGLREEYENDIKKLFSKKGKEKREAESAEFFKILDAVLGYLYLGKTSVRLSPELAERFKRIKPILDQRSDSSTESLNHAVRIYRILEDEAKKHAEACKAMDVRLGRKSSLTLVKGVRKLVDKPKEDNGKGIEHGETGGKNGGSSVFGKYTYDEWVDRGYKKGTHTVVEIRADKKDVIAIPKAEKDRIKRVFEKFAPKQGVFERGLEEGDVDDELYAEWFAGLRAGRIDERLFYSRVVYEERDVATALLIDFSGSMHDVLPQVLYSSAMLAEISATLKDPLLVVGLNEGEQGSEFYVLKDLYERDVRLSIYGGDATPLAAPMRHLMRKMDVRGIREKNFKQVFVFTDGDANVGEQPVEDMRMAVKEAWTKHRIKTFMIGIASGEGHRKHIEQFLDKIVGRGNHLILMTNELGQLSVFFEKYYRKLVNKLV